MIEFVDCFGSSRNFFAALSAFNNEVVAAFLGAGSGNFVFSYCFVGSVVGCGNCSALGDGFATFRANCVAGVSIGGAGSVSGIFNNRFFMETFFNFGINCDAASTSLCAHGESNAICRIGENDGNGSAVYGYGCAINGVLPTVDIARCGFDYDLCHAGESNGYRGALMETGGVTVIANVTLGIAFNVGYGNAVLSPNLLAGGVVETVGLIGKADGCICYDGFNLLTFGALAVLIIVSNYGQSGCFAVTAFGTQFGNRTGSCASCIYSFCFGVGVLAEFGHPTIYHLCFSAMLTQHAVNGDLVTNGGFYCHSIITGIAGFVVNAVNNDGVGSVGNVHVTVRSLVNFSNDAGQIVFSCCGGFRTVQLAQSDCLLNSEGRVSLRGNGGGTNVALVIGFITGVLEFVDCFGFSRKFLGFTYGTVNNEVVAAFFGAGGGNFVFSYCLGGSVIEFVDCFGLSRKLVAALRAVNNAFVATFFGAGSGNFVLYYCLGGGVGWGNSIILVRFATCAGVGGIAFCGAGGGCYNGFVRVLVTVVYGTAINADVVIIVVVVLCGNVNSFLVIANRALTGLCAFFFASGIFYDVPIAQGVSDFFGCFGFSRNFITARRAFNNEIVATGCDTGGTDFIFYNCICGSVIKLADCLGLSRNFLGFTYGTVNNEVVAAFFGAGSGNFVFSYCSCRSVIEFVDCLGFSRKLDTALRAVNNAFVTTFGRAGSTNFVFSYCFSTGMLAGGSFCFA